MKICDRANRRCESLSLSFYPLSSLSFLESMEFRLKKKKKKKKEERKKRNERDFLFRKKKRNIIGRVTFIEENRDFGNFGKGFSGRWRGMGWVSLAFLSSGLAPAFPIAISIILGGVPSQHSLSYNVIIFGGAEGKAYTRNSIASCKMADRVYAL